MRRLLTTALSTLSVLAALMAPLLPSSPALASGDDYPWRTDTTNRADAFGFTKRQCVSFAAWELYQRGHRISNATQHWGSAYHWDETARALHKVVTTRPKLGAIAQWNSYERSAYYPGNGQVGTLQAGGYGHVAVVTGVYPDGTVRIEQYNMFGTRSYSVMRVRAPRYLYIAG
ncbi:MAG: CHAP domain-containing protein [Mycobacteriales bacterium]